MAGTTPALRLHKRRSSALPLTTVYALIQIIPAPVLFMDSVSQYCFYMEVIH